MRKIKRIPKVAAQRMEKGGLVIANPARACKVPVL
jgi:hypothetical protein